MSVLVLETGVPSTHRGTVSDTVLGAVLGTVPDTGLGTAALRMPHSRWVLDLPVTRQPWQREGSDTWLRPEMGSTACSACEGIRIKLRLLDPIGPSTC